MKSKYVTFANGDKIWIKENWKFHREDGPAVEYSNGLKYWYYHDQYIDCQSQEEFERIIALLIFE